MNIPVTEWFPAEVKPVHVGLYQRDWGSSLTESCDYWDGKDWWVIDEGDEKWKPNYQRAWRGLTSPHPEWKP